MLEKKKNQPINFFYITLLCFLIFLFFSQIGLLELASRSKIYGRILKSHDVLSNHTSTTLVNVIREIDKENRIKIKIT